MHAIHRGAAAIPPGQAMRTGIPRRVWQDTPGRGSDFRDAWKKRRFQNDSPLQSSCLCHTLKGRRRRGGDSVAWPAEASMGYIGPSVVRSGGVGSAARAFTLVELLVVIAIISILHRPVVAGRETARESARQVQCRNNLHQIGIAATAHVQEQGCFPSSGWGYEWIGDPTAASAATSPGAGLQPPALLGPENPARRLRDPPTRPTAVALTATPTATSTRSYRYRKARVAMFICPTAPPRDGLPLRRNSWNAIPTTVLNKTDYAANGDANHFLAPDRAPIASSRIRIAAGSMATRVTTGSPAN